MSTTYRDVQTEIDRADDGGDDLRFARGIVCGCLCAAPLWLLILASLGAL